MAEGSESPLGGDLEMILNQHLRTTIKDWNTMSSSTYHFILSGLTDVMDTILEDFDDQEGIDGTTGERFKTYQELLPSLMRSNRIYEILGFTDSDRIYTSAEKLALELKKDALRHRPNIKTTVRKYAFPLNKRPEYVIRKEKKEERKKKKINETTTFTG